MPGFWRNFWLRSLVLWPTAIALSLASLWCTPFLGKPLAGMFGIVNAISADDSFHFVPSMLLAALPVLPFWILAEPRLWGRREPLPAGSYLIFLAVFFLSFYICAYLDVYSNEKNPMLALFWLALAFVAAAFIAGGLSYTYYYRWRKRQDQMPSDLPDVF